MVKEKINNNNMSNTTNAKNYLKNLRAMSQKDRERFVKAFNEFKPEVTIVIKVPLDNKGRYAQVEIPKECFNEGKRAVIKYLNLMKRKNTIEAQMKAMTV